MAMNNIIKPDISIIASSINTVSMDNMIEATAASLYSSFIDNPKALEELQNEISTMKWVHSEDGNSVSFNIQSQDSDFVDSVSEGHDIPVTGGNGGIARNPDGSTYHSKAKVYGVPMPWAVLPKVDFFEEIKKRSQPFAKDAVVAALNENKSVFAESVKEELINSIKEVL